MITTRYALKPRVNGFVCNRYDDSETIGVLYSVIPGNRDQVMVLWPDTTSPTLEWLDELVGVRAREAAVRLRVAS
jgi:hypothetical protein